MEEARGTVVDEAAGSGVTNFRRSGEGRREDVIIKKGEGRGET